MKQSSINNMALIGVFTILVCVCSRFKLNSLQLVMKYSKTSLNGPTMAPALIGAIREVIGLESQNMVMGDRLAP